MANLPESATYDAGIYQLETTDPVVGGAAGKSNASAINLANRTAYLKAHVDLMETIVPQAEAEAGVAETLRGWNALRVRQAVMAATGGFLSKSVAGGTTTTLTAAEAGNGILRFTGALTADKAVVVPVSPTRSWIINNAITGNYTLTVKTPSGTGVVCSKGTNAVVWTDGINVYDALTDFDSPVLTGTPVAPTPATGVRSTAIATMQKFADEFASSKTAGGYQKLPSGLIMQWGAGSSDANGIMTFPWPIAFPNALLQGVACEHNPLGWGGITGCTVWALSIIDSTLTTCVAHERSISGTAGPTVLPGIAGIVLAWGY